MLREDQPVTDGSVSQSACELLIKYSRRRRSGARERRVVYLGRRTPAVTSAEVEIMSDHLGGWLQSNPATPHNDIV